MASTVTHRQQHGPALSRRSCSPPELNLVRVAAGASASELPSPASADPARVHRTTGLYLSKPHSLNGLEVPARTVSQKAATGL